MPGSIRRRGRPQVHNNVEHHPACAANEFGLKRRLRLIVQTADCPFQQTQTHVGLQRRGVDPLLRELALAPRSHEASATVYVRRGIDEPGALYSAPVKNHGFTYAGWRRTYEA